MVDELEGDLRVHVVVVGQDQGHLQHVLAVERHPGRPVRLLQRPARRQLRAAVEDADVVQPQKTPGEDVAPGRVLAVHPPVEVLEQALKGPLQESGVRPTQPLLVLVQPERGPGVHRRIDVAEVPLVGRDLPIRVEIELIQHQQQLLFSEIKIYDRQRDRMEGQVPGRVPRVFPLVRHRDHVGVQHVEPVGVPHALPGVVHHGMAVVLHQPPLEVVEVELLAPQHARNGLAVHPSLVVAQRLRRDPLEELVGLVDPPGKCRLEAAEGVVRPGWRSAAG